MAYVLKAAAIAAIFAAAVGHNAVQAQSAKLETNQVPPHIVAAARAAGGFEQISEAGVEIEAGRLTFKLKGRTREGRVREVDVLMSGEIEEIEEEIQQNEVPLPVMQAVQRWMANFRPTKIVGCGTVR
ncbi:hypothetical protein [Belnapia moabensis]|uniref:hypothetical protein n=1 Tax=Belnapia moabensis TaxID=365533 RepID=UPI0005BAD0D4|nr:hypothetical protein [Belnapia moabensis]